MNTPSATPAPSSKPSRYRWLVAGIFFVIYTIAAADRANLGVALPFLREEFHMSNSQAGALVSLFLIAYAVAQLPSAIIAARRQPGATTRTVSTGATSTDS